MSCTPPMAPYHAAARGLSARAARLPGKEQAVLDAYTLCHVASCISGFTQRLGEMIPQGATVTSLTGEQPVGRVEVADHHWLDDVYVHVARGESDAAIDVLFDHVDDILLAGEFEACDDLLLTIDQQRLDATLLVATLSITLAAADRLSNRADFVTRAERRLLEQEPDRANSLLGGLR